MLYKKRGVIDIFKLFDISVKKKKINKKKKNNKIT